MTTTRSENYRPALRRNRQRARAHWTTLRRCFVSGLVAALMFPATGLALDPPWLGEVGLFNFNYGLKAGEKRSNALLSAAPPRPTMAGTVVRQSVFWSCVQPRPDDWAIDRCKQIRTVDRLSKAGWRVQLVLRTKHGGFGPAPFWGTDADSGRRKSEVSYPPADLSDDSVDGKGHSASYHRFVTGVLDRYCSGTRCAIHSLVIENEANAEANWIGRRGKPGPDVEDYVRLVATARAAVSERGVDLKIYDSGLQGWAVLMNAVGQDLATDGAEAAARTYERGFRDRTSARKLKSRIPKRMKSPTIAKVRLMLESGLYELTDGLNFHHYQSPESIADVVGFLRGHLPADFPLVSNEVGIKDTVIGDASTGLVNAWMIRKMVYLLDAGVSPVVWFSVRSTDNVASFADDDGVFVPDIANAYNAFAARIGDGVRVVRIARLAATDPAVRRAELAGEGGRFTVAWFEGDVAGDWAQVPAAGGCEDAVPAWESAYMRILDCE